MARKKQVSALATLQDFQMKNKKIVQLYDRFYGYTPKQMAAFKLEWDIYYQKCKQTDAHTLYQDMREAVKNKDYQAVRILRVAVHGIRELRAFIQPPLCDNPYVWQYHPSLIAYRQILRNAQREQGGASE